MIQENASLNTTFAATYFYNFMNDTEIFDQLISQYPKTEFRKIDYFDDGLKRILEEYNKE